LNFDRGNVYIGLRWGAKSLARGGRDDGFFLRIHDGDNVGKRFLWAGLARRVLVEHDLDLDAEHALAEEDVADGHVDEIPRRLARVDHEAVRKLHRLCTRGPQFARHYNLAALRTGFHDEAEDSVASATNSESIEELILEALCLSDSRQASVLDFFGVELDRVFGEFETLLDERRQLADTPTLLAKNVLRVRRPDDDLSTRRGDANLDAAIAFLAELSGEKTRSALRKRRRRPRTSVSSKLQRPWKY